MKYARRRSIVPRSAALSWGGKRWEGEGRQERARGMDLSQHWEMTEKWSCCAQERRSDTRQTDSGGAEAMGPRAEGIQVPSKDRGQRASKVLPVKSEQLLFMHLGLWFRKKKPEKRPRWGNGSGEDVASCANIYWYPMQIRCPSFRIAVYMQSHTISMCVPGWRPLLNSYWKLISRLEREPVNMTVARLQR